MGVLPPSAPGVKFSFAHFLLPPSCLRRWQAAPWPRPLPALPPGPRAILDRVSFTRALSPAFLTCRASFCLGSCNTKGICAHSPSLVLSIVSRVRHPPLQSWLQAPGFPCPSQGPEPRSLRREVGGNLSSFLPDTLPSLLPSGPCALHPCVPSLSKLSNCLAPRRGRRPQRCPLLVSCLPPLPLAPQGDLHRPQPSPLHPWPYPSHFVPLYKYIYKYKYINTICEDIFLVFILKHFVGLLWGVSVLPVLN